jgi:hypothetical protein
VTFNAPPGNIHPLQLEDCNAFAILGAGTRALRSAGVPEDEVREFTNEATAGDYDHLLRTCMLWVDVS